MVTPLPPGARCPTSPFTNTYPFAFSHSHPFPTIGNPHRCPQVFSTLQPTAPRSPPQIEALLVPPRVRTFLRLTYPPPPSAATSLTKLKRFAPSWCPQGPLASCRPTGPAATPKLECVKSLDALHSVLPREAKDCLYVSNRDIHVLSTPPHLSVLISSLSPTLFDELPHWHLNSTQVTVGQRLLSLLHHCHLWLKLLVHKIFL